MTNDNLEKAVIEVLGAKNSDTVSDSITVLFNPSEYTISGGANYRAYGNRANTKNAASKKVQNFQGTSKQELSLELFLDTSEKNVLGGEKTKAEDVSKTTTKFTKLTRPVGELHEPPVVRFSWGPLKFRGYITSIRTTYTMFMEDGMPVRAKMSLTIQEVQKDENSYVEPFESPDRTKARTVTDSNSVWNIAQAEYGDPDMWRTICQASGIANPLDITSGTVLKVPALD